MEWMSQPRTGEGFTGHWIVFGLLLLGGGALALDGDLFWDEPGYLYVAAYVGQPDFLLGTFQPSAMDAYFYFPKIMHMLVVKGIVGAVGVGGTALAMLMGLYALLLTATLYLTYAILVRLLPDNRSIGLATAVTALTPIMLYLMFKTLPEAPALFFATLALYAFIRSMEQRAVLWVTVAAVALVAMALNRHSLGLLLASFVIAAFLMPPPGISRWLLIKRSLVTATLAVGLFLAVLNALGMGLDDFLLATTLFEKNEPLVFRLISTALELGVFWLLVPLALLAHGRRQLGFFMTWFLVATLPIVVLFAHVESRYLIQNLVPFAGLAALALDRFRPWLEQRMKTPGTGQPALALVLVTVVLGSNWVGLRLMPAEANIWQIRGLLKQIETAMAGDAFAVLTPWVTTDFYYLRFAHPSLSVYNVSDRRLNIMQAYASHETMANRYFQDRKLRSVAELSHRRDRLIYIGYGETFMLANAKAGLKATLGKLHGIDPEAIIPDREFIDHITTSWMWQHPDIEFIPLVHKGHYRAYEIRVHDSNPTKVATNPTRVGSNP